MKTTQFGFSSPHNWNKVSIHYLLTGFKYHVALMHRDNTIYGIITINRNYLYSKYKICTSPQRIYSPRILRFRDYIFFIFYITFLFKTGYLNTKSPIFNLVIIVLFCLTISDYPKISQSAWKKANSCFLRFFPPGNYSGYLQICLNIS